MPKVTDAHLAARREQILLAAMARFAEGGFHSTGMAEVIAATGLSAGAVYRYFPSKEALIRAIVEERVLANAKDVFEAILAQGVDDPVDAVAAALEIVDRASAQGEIDITKVAVQAWGEALRNPDILDVAQNAYATMRGYLAEVTRRAQEHGRVPSETDPDEVAKTLLSLVMGYVIQRHIMGDVDRAHYTAALRALTSERAPAAAVT
ncbi:MAG TPA: TetR/AcrR family transcriptional regulator [Lapillicoccus sp.]|jgi:AcrR family transcriptional regulator|nr:TetR/AcrR family transcriptional regulator [Lapillicoccus sp.]